MKLNLFLEDDRPEAKNLIDCYHYNQRNAEQYIKHNQFSKASVYIHNMAHNMSELQELKNRRDMNKQAWLQLKQSQGKQDMERVWY